jgi:hypothetical protein
MGQKARHSTPSQLNSWAVSHLNKQMCFVHLVPQGISNGDNWQGPIIEVITKKTSLNCGTDLKGNLTTRHWG